MSFNQIFPAIKCQLPIIYALFYCFLATFMSWNWVKHVYFLKTNNVLFQKNRLI